MSPPPKIDLTFQVNSAQDMSFTTHRYQNEFIGIFEDAREFAYRLTNGSKMPESVSRMIQGSKKLSFDDSPILFRDFCFLLLHFGPNTFRIPDLKEFPGLKKKCDVYAEEYGLLKVNHSPLEYSIDFDKLSDYDIIPVRRIEVRIRGLTMDRIIQIISRLSGRKYYLHITNGIVLTHDVVFVTEPGCGVDLIKDLHKANVEGGLKLPDSNIKMSSCTDYLIFRRMIREFVDPKTGLWLETK